MSNLHIKWIKKIKRESKLIYQLTKEIVELTERSAEEVESLKKEKHYYMDEYKKVSDKLHQKSEPAERGIKASVKCEDETCAFNVNGVCHASEVVLELGHTNLYCQTWEASE